MDQARMKRGLLIGQQVGRKKSSHAKNSKVKSTALQTFLTITGGSVQPLSQSVEEDDRRGT